MARQEQEQFSTDIVNRPAADNSDPHAGSFYVSVKVKPRLPDFLNSVNLKYVKLGYGYLIAYGGFYFLIAAVILGGAELRKQLLRDDVVFLVGMLGFLICISIGLTPRSTYLLDFACYRPPNHLKISKKEFMDLAIKSGNFNDAAIEFQRRVLDNSGIGDETYMPMTVFKPIYNLTLLDGREEAAMAMFSAINDLLAQTKIRTKDIKILIVNCGVLNTTPSLSSMVVNHFEMRNDIQSFNLGGMGCSAGIIAIDLANDLLSAYPGSYAMVVSTEAVTYTWYKGSDLSMLLPNCFFRMGAAALILSNSHRVRWRAKYELKQLVRTHKGMDDESFKCVRLREDARGRQGISVGGSVIGVGSHALQHNIAALAHLLHLSPHHHYFFSNKTDREEKIKLCNVPNCALAFDHVCVLAAGKRVLDEVQSELGVREELMEPSRRTLERFGNTSSSSVWYQLAFLEAGGKIKRSDRILQIAFGSGFKCNSAVFKALRTPSKPRLSPWYGGDGVLNYEVK